MTTPPPHDPPAPGHERPQPDLYAGGLPPEHDPYAAGTAPYPGQVRPAPDPYAAQVPPAPAAPPSVGAYDAGYGAGPGFDGGPHAYGTGYGAGQGYEAGQGYGDGLYAFRPGDATSGGPGYPGAADAEAYPQDFGAAGGAYVPEPLGGQLPAQADPGAAFGVPSAGNAWGGGSDPAAEAYRGPVAADGWAQQPAPGPAWDAQSAAPGWDGQPGGAAPGWEAQHAPAAEQTAVMEPVPVRPPDPADQAPAPAPAQPPVRTGSPIIPPGVQPAALTAALGLLTAGAATVGRPLLAVVLVVLEGVTAAGWFRLNGMWPARQGIVLAFLAGVTADVALLAANGGHNAEVLLGTLGGWLLLVLVLQLRHHGSADERLASLTATSASTLLTVVAAAWLAAARSGAGTDPVVVGAIAVAAATVVRAVRLPVRGPAGDAVSLLLAVLAAAATGLATGPATGFGTGHAALLAAACGVSAAIGLRVASYDFPSRFVHFTAGVALPLTAAAPVVYLLGNAWN